MTFLVATNVVASRPPERRPTATPTARAKKKIKTFLVATNVVASRPPERRPTGTPTTRANIQTLVLEAEKSLKWSRYRKTSCSF